MYNILFTFIAASVATVAPVAAQPCEWSALGQGVDNYILALTSFDDGSGPALYAGGAFQVAGGSLAFSIARWDGASWSAVGAGFRDGSVSSFAVFDDGRGDGPALYAGGSFETSGGKPVRGIARWNGSSWDEVGGGIAGGASKPAVRALCVFDDGSGPALYAGGTFGGIGGVPGTRFIARWDGESWSPVGGGMHSYVYALDVFDDGSGPALHVGGLFRPSVGSPFNYIAKWDGGSWADVGGGLNERVNKLTVFDDGRGLALYVGGEFGAAGGVAARYIARWNGTAWEALGGGLNRGVGAMTVHDDGSGPALYVGGGFTLAGDIAASAIARWDGKQWASLAAGMGGSSLPEVTGLAVFDDGSGRTLYAGGTFRTAGSAPANRIARWSCDPCYADCDRDGSLTFFDFLCFQNGFAAMDPGADCDGSGDLTFFDFLCFQNAFAAACT
jgi:hypothetical protein